MYRSILFSLFFLVLSFESISQTKAQDSIFLMNGIIIVKQVIDTTFNTVTIMNPKKHGQKIHYESDQLYMVKYANGYKRYYYYQDPDIYNIFTRDEMWLFMKGEADARKGFKARGALITAGVIGFAAGTTGSLFAPIAPYGFMALSGVTKIRIRHNTISNKSYIDSDAYILGYERVARQRRKFKALIGGTVGLVLGYTFYGIFHKQYSDYYNR